MAHPVPTPPSSGENLLMDDDDIILLTDEIPPSEDDDIIELCELADRSQTRTTTPEIMKFTDPTNEETGFIDLNDVIEASDLKTERLQDLSLTETETLNPDFDQILESFLLEPKMPVEDTVPLDDHHKNDAEMIKELAADDDFDTDNDLILLQDIAPLALENEFVESLSLAIEPAQSGMLVSPVGPKAPVTEYQMDDLQQLIDEVVHDSQVPHQDLPGIHADLNPSTEKDAAINSDMMASLSRDQIDAALERVIRTLFAERISLILDEVVTTTVTREIDNLKTIFLDYLTSGQSADKN